MIVNVKMQVIATEDNGIFKKGYEFTPTFTKIETEKTRLFNVIEKLAEKELILGYNVQNRKVIIELEKE
tara:strand:+ start:1471 stop:1677 length:207 start_codon:yes stop_codon:yes gene_type:complete